MDGPRRPGLPGLPPEGVESTWDGPASIRVAASGRKDT
jgi:hypothetical protein